MSAPPPGDTARPGFLEDAELARLTGRKMKSKQIAWLRNEGLPFFVSATGHPVVAWSAVDLRRGPAANETTGRGWAPRVIQGG